MCLEVNFVFSARWICLAPDVPLICFRTVTYSFVAIPERVREKPYAEPAGELESILPLISLAGEAFIFTVGVATDLSLN